MPATGNSDGVATRVLLGRLARSVWTSLVAYGSMWVPVDENPLWQRYQQAMAADPRTGGPQAGAPRPDGGTDSDRKTSSAN
ncbi:hypothetical protein KV205_16150 [Streptomyces sp. SKN60]|uniref:hypothetical protein n=1 Tax=Streptomyces sp. SKN60 TaxID=2855506 RepID=UPI002247B54E|nr:hypothetical protein [Streptomyces sp. SKN60]MCX2182055.1 hypothetical protein [Streptomyces sp. SKN60]